MVLQISDNVKVIIDGVAMGTTVAAIASWIPPIAGLFSIAWLGMQMYDWIQKKRGK